MHRLREMGRLMARPSPQIHLRSRLAFCGCASAPKIRTPLPRVGQDAFPWVALICKPAHTPPLTNELALILSPPTEAYDNSSSRFGDPLRACGYRRGGAQWRSPRLGLEAGLRS